MNKSQRQFAIKEIISQQSVGSQEELSTLLHKRGFDATQATLSRDLAELGVVRIHTEGGLRYTLNPANEEIYLSPILLREVLTVDANESLIVIRTLPGRAQGVASYLDSLRNPLLLGTVAGDDTVFVTPSSTKKISQLQKIIKELLFKN